MAEERKVQLGFAVDATGARQGFQEVKDAGREMAQGVQQSAQQAGKAIDGMGSGGGQAAQKVGGAARSIIGSIQRTTATMRAGEKGTASYYEALAGARGVNTDILRPYLEQLRQVEAAQKSATAALAGGSTSMEKMGVSTGQTNAALRQLPAQLTDIVTSLQGGQKPLTVLIQQGGQIKDAFGGIGETFRALGGQAALMFPTIAAAMGGVVAQQQAVAESAGAAAEGLTDVAAGANDAAEAAQNASAAISGVRGSVAGASSIFLIATAGILAVVAAAAGLAVAYRQGAKESADFDFALLKTGNILGTTTGQLREMAQAIGGQGAYTEGAAAQALTALASGGKVASASLKDFTQVALEMKDYVGQSIEDTAKIFSELGEEPTKAVLKLSESLHFLTMAQLEQIMALEKQGDKTRAAQLAQEAYAASVRPTIDAYKGNLDALDVALRYWTDRGKEMWDALVGKGRQETGEQRIAALKQQLAGLNGANPLKNAGLVDAIKGAFDSSGTTERLKAQTQAQINYLERVTQAAKDNAKFESERKRAQEAGVSAMAAVTVAQDKGLTKTQQMNKALEDYRKNIADIRAANPESTLLDAKKIAAGEAAIREQFKEKSSSGAAPAGESELAAMRAKTAAARDYLKALQENGLAADKQNEFEAQASRLQKELEGGIKGVARANKEKTLAEALAGAEVQKSIDAQKALLKVQADFENARDKEAMASAAEIQKINEKAQALEDEAAAYGKTAVELQALTVKRLEDKAAMLAAFDPVASQDEIARIDEMIAGLTRLGAAGANLGGIKSAADENKKALDDLNNFLDPSKAESFGDALKGAFEGAGSALAGLANAFDDYAKQEAVFAKQRENLGNETDPKKAAKDAIALSEMQAKAQISAYASMAGAAKGFFKEGTTGYKTMGAAEKAFRATELAQALYNTAKKVGLVAVETTTIVAGQKVVTVSSLAEDAKRLAAKIPLIFASFLSMNPIIGIPLAIAAMAAVGIVAGGGGGGSALPATNDGTGTVFGDASAKSESIEKTIDLLESISKFGDIENSYAAKMLASLRSIESQIGGFTNVILRSGGIDGSGADMAAAAASRKGSGLNWGIDGLSAKIDAALFGKKVTVTGQGLYADDSSIQQIAAGGMSAGYYTDVNTKKKAFGITYSDKNSINKTQDDEVSRQISLIVTNFADAVTLAAPVLGLSLDTIDASLQDFVVKIGRVDLKDLTGDEIQEKLSAVFGAAGDNIAQAAIPGLEHLQQVGEGYFETLARVASNLSSVNQMFDTLGVKLFDSSITGAEASLAFSDLFGGLENMASVVGDYYEAFYTEEERMAKMTASLTEELAKAGKEMPATKDAYREMVTAALKAGEGGAELAAKLMKLGPAFAQVTDYAAALLESAGISGETIASTLRDAMLGRVTASDAGAQIADMVTGGIYNAIAGGLAQQLTDLLTSSLITPVVQAAVAGASISEAVSQSAIDSMVAQARAAAEALNTIFSDPAFRAAIESVGAAIASVTQAAGGAAFKPYTPSGGRGGGGETVKDTRRDQLSADKILAGLVREISQLGMTDLERELAGIADRADEYVQSLQDLGQATAANIASVGAWETAMLDAIAARNKAAAGETIAGLMKEVAQLDMSDLEKELAGISDRADDYIKGLREIGQATGANIASVNAWADAMSAAAQTADAAALRTTATDDAFAALERAVGVQRDLLTETIQDLQAVFDMTRDAARDLYSEVESASQQSAAAGRAFIDNALANARATGYLPDSDALREAIDGVRKGIAQQQGVSTFESERDRLVLAGKLTDIKDIAEPQLTVAQQQLRALEESLTAARTQIDELRGINVSVLSVADAMSGLAAAIAAEAASRPVVTPAAPGGAGGGGASNAALIANAYQSLLGRAPDADGAAHWANALASGSVSAAGLQGAITSSAAGWIATNGMDAYTAQFGASSTEKLKDLIGFDVGINRVPYDMTARIHEGEAVVPARFNPFNPSARQNGLGGNTERLEALVEGLTAEVQRLQSIVAKGVEHQRETTEILDNVTEGGNAMRSEVMA